MPPVSDPNGIRTRKKVRKAPVRVNDFAQLADAILRRAELRGPRWTKPQCSSGNA